MARYRSVRNGRRKTPTLCPTQRDNRKRARVCGSSGECTIYEVGSVNWEEGSQSGFINALDGPSDIDPLTGVVIYFQDQLQTTSSAAIVGGNLEMETVGSPAENDTVSVFIPAMGNFCARMVVGFAHGA